MNLKRHNWFGLPQPVALRDVRVAANGVVLIGNPDDDDYVESRGGVVEEFGHDGFNS